MFAGASVFNQPLNNWNVSNVIDMSYMFDFASAFNQPLDKWNVSKVTDYGSFAADGCPISTSNMPNFQ